MRHWLAAGHALGQSALGVVGMLLGLGGAMAAEYLSNPALAARLQGLAQQHPQVIRLSELAQSARTNPVWLIELGEGSDTERASRPAVLVVAGIEGNDLAGTVSVVAWVEQLCRSQSTNDAIRKLLRTVTVYALPRLNADAAEAFFARPKTESALNSRPVDEDHDGLSDEDGPEDLNGDGLVTFMRLNDPKGEYILDPAEPRLLVRADRAKGQVGAWRLLTEGRDNDGDMAWNEDGPGGVNLNRNFPYNYRFFAPEAGRYQISEPETRALADFVVKHPNIAAVFTFGAADNLTQTPKAEPPKRPPTALHEQDADYYRELGKAWRQALGLTKELPGHSAPGTFSDWMYFHRGRLSLAARAWSPALAVAMSQTQTNGPGPTNAPAPGPSSTPPSADQPLPKPKAADSGSKADKPDTAAEEERAFLKWADTHAPELFVAWQPIQHPDFPDQRLEVGGWAPFAKTQPPETLLADLANRHAQFLTELAGRLPRIELGPAKVKDLRDGVFDLTLTIRNAGYLPTALAQGEFSRQVPPTRVTLHLDDKAVLAGTKRVMLGPIPGSGGTKEVRWVILAPGRDRVEVEVVSALGGTVRSHIELKDTGEP